MPLKLPNLDDRRWNDLVEEGRSLIPAFTPDWTNYNPADPGITLVELFAFFTENLMYRVNRVGDENVQAFIRLIRGPDWTPGSNVDEDVRETLRDLHKPHRAVTMEDYEALTLAVNEGIPAGEISIARVRAIPNRNLESGKPNAQVENTPGHVSVVIVPPETALLKKVRDALEPARLLTTVIHVVPPRFVELGIRLTITVPRGAEAQQIRGDVAAALRRFFSPSSGGPDRSGWPFGRNVYVSEIYQIAAGVAGVTSVSRSIESLTKQEVNELVLTKVDGTRIIRNEAQAPEAVLLRNDELVALTLRDEDIVAVEEGGEN